MITRVEISNFKSIRGQVFEDLPPIVGIWGKNGTGKSSFLQAIVYAAKNQGDPRVSNLNLGSYENIVFGRKYGRDCSIKIMDSSQRTVDCSIQKDGIFRHNGVKLDQIRYFPPWRHISSRASAVHNVVNSDIGYRASEIHTFLHWFLHELIGKIALEDEEAKKIYKRINYWSERIGYGRLFDHLVSQNTVMGIYEDPIFHLQISFMDGGFGGNSFLPILLECYKFKNGIILIEEPEISLHPGAQGDIWEFMKEMVEERGHQIIFTSHSPYLATKIARTLRDGKLKNKIRIYLTSKEEDKGTHFEVIKTKNIIERFNNYWEDILQGLEGR